MSLCRVGERERERRIRGREDEQRQIMGKIKELASARSLSLVPTPRIQRVIECRKPIRRTLIGARSFNLDFILDTYFEAAIDRRERKADKR